MLHNKLYANGSVLAIERVTTTVYHQTGIGYVAKVEQYTVVHRLSWDIRFDFSVKYLKNCDEKLFERMLRTYRCPLKLERNAAVVTKLPRTKAGEDDKWVKRCSS